MSDSGILFVMFMIGIWTMATVFALSSLTLEIKQHTAQEIIEAYNSGREDIIMETIDDQ